MKDQPTNRHEGSKRSYTFNKAILLIFTKIETFSSLEELIAFQSFSKPSSIFRLNEEKNILNKSRIFRCWSISIIRLSRYTRSLVPQPHVWNFLFFLIKLRRKCKKRFKGSIYAFKSGPLYEFSKCVV